MKILKFIIVLSVFAIATTTFVDAQTAKEEKPSDTSVAPTPETHQQVQENVQTDEAVPVTTENQEQVDQQSQPDISSGTSTYNIDDNQPAPVETGAAPFRGDNEVEELRIYSGQHDGNNYIKTVDVKTPARGQGGYVPR